MWACPGSEPISDSENKHLLCRLKHSHDQNHRTWSHSQVFKHRTRCPLASIWGAQGFQLTDLRSGWVIHTFTQETRVLHPCEKCFPKPHQVVTKRRAFHIINHLLEKVWRLCASLRWDRVTLSNNTAMYVFQSHVCLIQMLEGSLCVFVRSSGVWICSIWRTGNDNRLNQDAWSFSPSTVLLTLRSVTSWCFMSLTRIGFTSQLNSFHSHFDHYFNCSAGLGSSLPLTTCFQSRPGPSVARGHRAPSRSPTLPLRCRVGRWRRGLRLPLLLLLGGLLGWQRRSRSCCWGSPDSLWTGR